MKYKKGVRRFELSSQRLSHYWPNGIQHALTAQSHLAQLFQRGCHESGEERQKEKLENKCDRAPDRVKHVRGSCLAFLHLQWTLNVGHACYFWARVLCESVCIHMCVYGICVWCVFSQSVHTGVCVRTVCRCGRSVFSQVSALLLSRCLPQF